MNILPQKPPVNALDMFKSNKHLKLEGTQ